MSKVYFADIRARNKESSKIEKLKKLFVKASYDLVNEQEGIKHSHLKDNFEKGKDKFKGVRKNTKSTIQLTYGEKLGFGQLDYEIIKI